MVNRVTRRLWADSDFYIASAYVAHARSPETPNLSRITSAVFDTSGDEVDHDDEGYGVDHDDEGYGVDHDDEGYEADHDDEEYEADEADDTISVEDDSEARQSVLVRSTYADSINDYRNFFKRLQLKSDFYGRFLGMIKEYRADPEVRESLMTNTSQSVEEVSEDFLKMYGKNVWKLKGKNCQQDKKYKVTFMQHKNDEGKLLEILDDMFFHMRNLLFKPRLIPVTTYMSMAALRRRKPPLQPTYPAPLPCPPPNIDDIDAEEEASAVTFINKVRVEVHGLQGTRQPRKLKKEDIALPTVEKDEPELPLLKADNEGPSSPEVDLTMDQQYPSSPIGRIGSGMINPWQLGRGV